MTETEFSQLKAKLADLLTGKQVPQVVKGLLDKHLRRHLVTECQHNHGPKGGCVYTKGCRHAGVHCNCGPF